MAHSDRLLEETRAIRDEISRHPFVRGIEDGTLPAERFGFYLAQDYRFLIEYCRVFGLAVAKASDLELMTRLAGLLHSTLDVEMELHRSYSARFGVSREDLERAEASPVTRAYTSHLLTVAWGGGLGEIVASLLPCQWGYWELALEMVERGRGAADNPYAEWIATYSSPEFGELATWLRGVVDAEAEGARPEDLARMEKAFRTSSRYELMFWDAAWRMEPWPGA